jgi:hypothetical protein
MKVARAAHRLRQDGAGCQDYFAEGAALAMGGTPAADSAGTQE